jgi:hypothetical protein
MKDKYWFALLLGFLLGWFILPLTGCRPAQSDRSHTWQALEGWNYMREHGYRDYAYPVLGYPVYGSQDHAGMHYERFGGWEVWSR